MINIIIILKIITHSHSRWVLSLSLIKMTRLEYHHCIVLYCTVVSFNQASKYNSWQVWTCLNLKHTLCYLLGQLVEEELGEAGDLVVAVHDAAGQLADLTFHLHHVVEDQVGQHLQCVLAHQARLVTQPEKPHRYVIRI